MSRTSRNKPCPCGSGKKYKNCCGKKGAEPLPSRGRRFWTGLGYLVLLAAVSVVYVNLDDWKAYSPPPPATSEPSVPAVSSSAPPKPDLPAVEDPTTPSRQKEPFRKQPQQLPQAKPLPSPDEDPPELTRSLDSAMRAKQAGQSTPPRAADSAGQ